MSDRELNITDFLEKARSLPVIDVRSPAEYQRGHIPGAVNLPLFSNEERSIIGTLYLRKGSSEAMMKGLELIGPKMRNFAQSALGIAPGKEALLHCWRGGMRSNSMAWLLNTIGIRASTLEGGYRNYRRYVREYFEKPVNLKVIGGMTGSGKSEVLEALEQKGKQIIHLERLASHKGSVFGGIGMSPQPSTEQFENDLCGYIRQLNRDEPVYVEDESLAIGRVFIPRPFFDQMSSAVLINLMVPLARRIRQLVRAYSAGDSAQLIAGVKHIERRLGLEHAAFVVEHIKNGEMELAVERVLKYYDKVYALSMTRNKRKEIIQQEITEENPEEIANKIIFLTKHDTFII